MPKDISSTEKAETMMKRGTSSLAKQATSSVVTAVSSAAGSGTRNKSSPDLHASELPDSANASLRFATLDNLEKDTMGPTWCSALQPEFEKPYFRDLKAFLRTEYTNHTVFPPLNNVYSWSTLTPLDEVKVVILGQDPYHDVGQAHGLSFSVLPPTKLPGSLKNIYKQMAADDPSFTTPTSGDLSPLARAGVLWLNTCLTVRAHKANSHSRKGWETLTAQALRVVLDRPEEVNMGVVFMLWGLPSQKTGRDLGIDEEKHLVLRSPHPSPLSAHRGFLGNGHFKKANEWLKERYGPEGMIDWKVMCRA